jgi:hypothetical protein
LNTLGAILGIQLQPESVLEGPAALLKFRWLPVFPGYIAITELAKVVGGRARYVVVDGLYCRVELGRTVTQPASRDRLLKL